MQVHFWLHYLCLIKRQNAKTYILKCHHVLVNTQSTIQVFLCTWWFPWCHSASQYNKPPHNPSWCPDTSSIQDDTWDIPGVTDICMMHQMRFCFNSSQDSKHEKAGAAIYGSHPNWELQPNENTSPVCDTVIFHHHNSLALYVAMSYITDDSAKEHYPRWKSEKLILCSEVLT